MRGIYDGEHPEDEELCGEAVSPWRWSEPRRFSWWLAW
jgi:hypothetical protein